MQPIIFPAMIDLTERLIKAGNAYPADGHVLFAVESMPGYGALSGRKLEDMLAGARVEVADYKRHAGDFVLWKPSAADEPGWDSPWGAGKAGLAFRVFGDDSRASWRCDRYPWWR